MKQVRDQPCPRCHDPHRLTLEETARKDFVCDSCHQEIMEAVSEGMSQDYQPSRNR